MSHPPSIYFHIGSPKTGISTIQGFLNYNREYLAGKYGMLYPNFNSSIFKDGLQHNHSQFFLMLLITIIS